MLNRITHTFIPVMDQDEALTFYVDKLGMQVADDVDLGVMRWLTVSFPAQPDIQIVLMKPGPPVHSPEITEELRALVAKGAAGGGVIFATDNCRGTYEELLAKGVEFTQEPTEQPYGIDCGIRDPFGNHLRFTEVIVPAPAA